MSKMKSIPLLLASSILLLSGCGGSTEGQDGENGDGENPGTGANSVLAFAGAPQLNSDADQPEEGVAITAILRNANNNAVAGEPVDFSVDNDGTLIIGNTTTDENGRAQATLITPGNRATRTLRVTAASGSAQDSVNVDVIGTDLNLTGPDSIVLNDSASYTITLRDAGGAPITGENVAVDSALANTISASSLNTNNAGQIDFQLTANNAGDDTLTAQALGLTATREVSVSEDDFRLSSPMANIEVPTNTNRTVTVSWDQAGVPIPDGTNVTFSATRGSFVGSGSGTQTTTTSGGTASVEIASTTAGPTTIEAVGETAGESPSTRLNFEFVATVPELIVAQAVPQTLGSGEQSGIRAVVRDLANNPVKNQTVNFSVTGTSGGVLSAPTAVTDSSGIAEVTFTAGPITTGQRQIIVETSIPGSAVPSDQVQLTVARRAIDIEFGTGNVVEVPDEQRFVYPYQVLVTDTAGNPIEDAEVQLNIVPTRYFKGTFNLTDTDLDGTADRWVANVTAACINEDVDGDGFEEGEDLNNNGVLDPGNAAQVPTSVTTGEDGFASFGITYLQDRNQWVEVRLEATTDVAGSEDIAISTVVLPALADDINNVDVAPPGTPSPFGTQPEPTEPFCSNPS
ncbi:Ig-like domain-containing protein [Salinisphaera sp. P385]|uniref:Ig-like domain-containing protein n=1 Tax=Spectribacter acetivorans TaxID=3075603 RepID=A0ABU3BC49_9GAMM|nr:Ig-like domain-containing protein [Salinisphaera sp. P385]MDT0619680.1 Ig-like domain-containing protein [Salinisphaera sp. P385]